MTSQRIFKHQFGISEQSSIRLRGQLRGHPTWTKHQASATFEIQKKNRQKMLNGVINDIL